MISKLSDPMDQKYVVNLIKQSYYDNDYGDWHQGSKSTIAEFKTIEDAQEFLSHCKAQHKETQRKYSAPIDYELETLYLRERTVITQEWTNEARPQKEIDKANKKFWACFESKDKIYVG